MEKIKLYRVVPNNRSKSLIFPEELIVIITGPSGSGKTCLLMHMLLTEGMLDYDNLVIYSKSSNQPIYQMLNLASNNGVLKELTGTLLSNG